ncbi:hypothetical protein C8R45DRAFT_1221271 [Mycena sanguinolenta]|nr:hypothetical protein C8R45DRAFT_1221271 [Mycena sanguinolenta]
MLLPQASRPETLCHFTWDDRYELLLTTLWPAAGNDPSSFSTEPPSALRACIETLAPNDAWLTSSGKKTDPDESDAEDEEQVTNDEALSEDIVLRYINFQSHPALAIGLLAAEVDRFNDMATFVVRREYDLFMRHAILGSSFGSYYFLFWLLGLGESVFLVSSPTTVYYFSSAGVQKSDKMLEEDLPSTVAALLVSWVLIDTDDRGDWMPDPKVFKLAKCIVWTSLPMESRKNYFIKRFCGEIWYMQPWTTKEIAGVTERLQIERQVILDRLNVDGPVARSLWGSSLGSSTQTLDNAIWEVLQGNILRFKSMDPTLGQGIHPVHRVFMVRPLAVIDKESGAASLQRREYSVGFISPYVVRRTLNLAEEDLERVQGQLSAAFNLPTTCSVARRLVEGMMHRALTRSGMLLPDVFGANTTVAGTRTLIGSAGNFVCETLADMTDTNNTGTSNILAQGALYLRPESLTFATVDSIIVTRQKLGFIRVPVRESHRGDFGMMLRIMSRLRRGAQVDVDRFDEVIYCVVGTVSGSVQELMAEASGTLAELKDLDAQKLSKALGMKQAEIAHTRLSGFRVVGYTFDYKRGFTEVKDE